MGKRRPRAPKPPPCDEIPARCDAFPRAKATVTARDYKAILLRWGSSVTFSCGVACTVKGRSLGAGVYEVWLEPKDYGDTP